MPSIVTDLKRFEVHSGGFMGSPFSFAKDGDVLILSCEGAS